ncbi:MAG: hypothetical protein ACKVKF_02525 [Rhodobacterales bacterium]
MDAFVLNGTMLVVDIAKLDPNRPIRNLPTQRNTAQSMLGRDQLLIEPVAPAIKTFGALPLDKLAEGAVRKSEVPQITGDRPAEPNEAAILELERGITEQLARAVTSGLLEISASTKQPGMETRTGNSEGQGDQLSVPADQQTRQETPVQSLLEDGRILLSGDRCIADADLTLADWAEDADFDAQLSDLRRGLVDELDRIDEAAALRLAEFYLHFGMGPEAKAHLLLADTPKAKTLEGLANLLEDQPDPAGTFSGQTHCDGAAALWSLLDLQGAKSDHEINTRAILRGFDELPDNLKGYLANRLVSQLLVSGENAAAQDLMKRINRAQPEPSPAIELAKARLDIGEGNLGAASSRLAEVARNSSGESSAQAVEALMELNAESGKKADKDISELASAYSVEMRGTEDGPTLWRANVRGMIGKGNFEEAFGELNSQSSGDPQIDAETRTEAANAMIRNSEDLTFMRIALSPAPEHPLGLARPTLLAAAERMLALGLPDAASQFLAKVAPDRSDREARVLSARILLAQTRPDDAEIALIGLQGQDILELRAEARAMMGDSDFAQQAYDEFAQPGAPVDPAWVASDWTTAADPAQGPLSDAARVLRSDPILPDAARAASIGGSKALVGDSEAARETLRALLESTQITPDG